MKNKTRTRGNVIVEEIKVGDIHYEYDYGCYVKVRVLHQPKPTYNDDGDIMWQWQSENVMTGKIVEYAVNQQYSSVYGPKLYDYEAYQGFTQI